MPAGMELLGGALVLAAAALAPLALAWRRRRAVRGRRDSAIGVHRAQLAELDRDLADDRIAAAEHAGAVLEVQRRLLSAAALPDETDVAPAGHRRALGLTLVAVPLAGVALYLVGGHPELPAAPLEARLEQADRQEREATALIQTLRARLATLDPKSETTRQGYVLLGNSEAAIGHPAEAAAAWSVALASRFDPTLAAETAEARFRADGRVSEASAALFRRALDAAPADAPWRALALQRLGEPAAK